MAMMASKVVAGLAVLASGVKAFEPFADVEELRVRPMKEFCADKDPKTGFAVCSHHVKKTLEDGGDVELSWRVHADPDSMLSLDTEKAITVMKCGLGSLDLDMPEEYVKQYAKPDTLILASRFVKHTCGHLPVDKHMFKKVLKVAKVEWKDLPVFRRAHVRFHTKDLEHMAEALPEMHYNFSYVPVEAKQTDVAFPPMVTNSGVRCASPPCDPFEEMEKHRRLLKTFETEVATGNPDTNQVTEGGAHTENSLLKLMPKQISNFGWNWNFFMNSSEEPEFNYTLPGLDGYVKLKEPYIKMHAGLFLNFSAKFGTFLSGTPPHVKFTAGILGHGVINARMMTDLKTTRAASEDPFFMFNLPVLEALKKTRWFSPIDFGMGAIPITMEPGFQFGAEMYHTGDFEGTLQLGGITHAVMRPEIQFDSDIGFRTSVKAEFKDTTLYPPLWIVSTDHFEMGVMLEPVMWLKGQFGPNVPSEKMGFEARPYVNLTLMREGGAAVGDNMKTLIAYPFRVMGLQTDTFQKKYKVKVTANKNSVASTAALNWGEVEVHDHLSVFNMGQITQADMLSQKIQVALIEVDEASGSDTELGKTEVKCESLLNGECQPNPTIAQMNVNGATVSVELVVLWQKNPVPWFASRIRGVSISFPTITLNQDALTAAVPELANGGTPKEKMYLRVTHGDITYVTEVSGFSSYQTGSGLSGASVIEFGPTFLESWRKAAACPVAGECTSGKIQLFYGSTLLGSSQMPAIPWNTVPDLVVDDGSRNVASSETLMALMQANPEAAKQSFMSGIEAGLDAATGGVEPPTEIPVSVTLKPANGGSYQSIAIVHAQATVLDPATSSSFLYPSKPLKVTPQDATVNFQWTTAYVQRATKYTFRLSTWKVVASTASTIAANAQYPSVGNLMLQPIANGQQTITSQCSQAPIEGIASDGVPCSFQHALNFAGGFTTGDRIVMMVEWIEGTPALDHVMFSPPIEIVASISSTGRRLDGPVQRSLDRRLWTKEDWNQRLDANQDSCNKEDIRFELGFGMMVRSRMTDKAGFYAMMRDPSTGQMPMLSSGFQNLGSETLEDADLADMLPKELCSDGICKGTMPGCTKANFKKMYFPELLFNLHKSAKFSDLGAGSDMVKLMMAYAFSTLPEMVEVMIEELNATGQIGHGMGTTPPPTVYPWQTSTAPLSWGVTGAPQVETSTPPPKAGGAFVTPSPPQGSTTPAPNMLAQAANAFNSVFGNGAAQAQQQPAMQQQQQQQLAAQQQPAAQQQQQQQAYQPYQQQQQVGAYPAAYPSSDPAAAAAAAAQMGAAPQNGQPWMPSNPALYHGRRLRAAADSNPDPQAHLRGRSGSFQRVHLRFKQGLPIVVDRKLIDMMMRHHMFQEITDDEGSKIFINDYEVHSGSDDIGAEDDSVNSAVPRPWHMDYKKKAAKPAVPPAQFSIAAFGVFLVAVAAVAMIAVVRRSSYLVLRNDNEESAVE
eukprot:TRINITY_DN11_c3_g1_i2.p1 TRINITY_DN11_c3_g1~~TRINITY_DN11_c3_g1_i2.p1  ORF type:complete len:1465 (-),score=485.05 TRINITY_DN11_c3_g1_i2:174-4568(-)